MNLPHPLDHPLHIFWSSAPPTTRTLAADGIITAHRTGDLYRCDPDSVRMCGSQPMRPLLKALPSPVLKTPASLRLP